MNVKAIFLDFYGTLVYEDTEVISGICEKIRKTSPNNPEIKDIASYWWKRFFPTCVESYGENFQSQRNIELESLKDTVLRFNCNQNAEDLSNELFNYWTKPPIYKDTLQFLDMVKIPICIVSNIDRADLISAASYHGIKDINIISSEDARSYKPRPEIFNKAIELMKVRPEEVLHIGDSLSSDVAGAKSLGIKTLWLNRKEKKNSSEHRADIECSSLLEVIKNL